MKHKLPSSLFETVLILSIITGMTFVPDSIIPFPAWALILGTGNIGYLLLRIVRHHSFLDGDIAPLMGGIFGFTLGFAAILDRQQTGISFIIALGAMLVAGIVWSVWKATRNEPKV